MIDELKVLKDTYESARQQIDKLKEPLDDLNVLNNFLTALVADPSLIKDKMDKDYKRYFFEDFAQGMLKRLTKEKSKNEKYLEVVGFILEQFLLIFAQQLKEENLNYAFFDSVRQIFEHETVLHQLHYQVPQEQLKKIKIDNSTQEWRNELKVGDQIDAIQDEILKCPGWSQAKIITIAGDTLQIEFTQDTKNTDRYVDRWSVDIAPFESKTKELFEWKKTLVEKMQIDASDKDEWIKSTILEFEDKTVAPDRVIKMVHVAFRIYVEKSIKNDEVGPYEGWSNRFDQWIAVYSPRIQPYYTKTQKGAYADLDIDEDFDKLFTPEEGHSRVFAVPRLRKCTSSLYIHLINQFGTQGGFDAILNILQKAQTGDEIDLNIVAVLLECVSKPYLVYHKDFSQEYAPKVVELAKNKIKNIPDNILRDVKRERLEGVVKGIDFLQRRNVSKSEREEQTENMKLEMCLTCLRSQFLDRKIQGLKDLNQIIKNSRFQYSKVFSNEFLIDWMHNNDVFSVLFDNKKTHLQIVQRCADILRLLLQEDKLTLKLTELFWNLSKSDYKPEVYKIVNEGAPLLKQEHIDYIFEQIKQIPAEKLTMEEFQCLGELGKFAKTEDFKVLVGQFFWKVICDSDLYKDELVNNCITKFCDMMRNWDLQKKEHYLSLLVKNLENKSSSIPSLKLFRGIIKDHLEAVQSNLTMQAAYGTGSTFKDTATVQQSAGDQETTDANAAQEEGEVVIKDEDKVTIYTVLNQLISQQKLVEVLLDNFTDYSQKVTNALKQGQGTIAVDNRRKLFLVNPKFSHHEEVDERLQFLKYIATISADFKISKKELNPIYEILVSHSMIPSDNEEFLIWCKTSCEQSSQMVQILDLNEVGEFFIEKMASKELDLKRLLVVGFEFLQHYFLTVNEKSQKLLKSPAKKKEKNNNNAIMLGFGPLPKGFFDNASTNDAKKNGVAAEEEDTGPIFKLLQLPEDMEKLDIVWKIALECENDKVVPKAISFLIRVYTQLDEELQDDKIRVQDQLIAKCIQIIKENPNDQSIIVRVLQILKNIIYEAEKKGTGGVQPHNAVLKGELLEKISVKNKASTKKNNLIMSVYSNTTVWEFRQEVATQFELSPKYLKLERADGSTIRDSENGKTLAQLNFQSGEIITAFKIYLEEEIAQAPLILDGTLAPKAKEIFNEWFNIYSDENGQMTKETCGLFIKGCTGETPGPGDERINGLFKSYDSNGDGKIEREEFLTFYETAAKSKPNTVRENLRSHNIRADLKKLSEVQEESSYSKVDMPRYKISKNQEYFDLLMKLLDSKGPASQKSWDLIQMLATNQNLYRRVLELQTAKVGDSNDSIDWSKFFDTQSIYKLLYTLQIVEAVMEDGDGSDRILVIQEEEKKKIPVPPPLPAGAGPILPPGASVPQPPVAQEVPIPPPIAVIQVEEEPKVAAAQSFKMKRSTSIVEDDEVDRELRSGWTEMFLRYHGFQYILNIFLSKTISPQNSLQRQNSNSASEKTFIETFELKHIAFLLKILRVFIAAAFSTTNQGSKEGGDANQTGEISKFKELQALVEGEKAQMIIESIDFSKIHTKILEVVSQTLDKKVLIFEDKLIIENALGLWVSCTVYKPALIKEFYDFKGVEDSQVKSGGDFILHGLLYCQNDKIRTDFKQALSQLTHEVMKNAQAPHKPLEYVLKVLSDHFAEISQYQCKQYFELFCELIDQYFDCINNHSLVRSAAFDPQAILTEIIKKIKEYNQLAAEVYENPNAEIPDAEKLAEQENIYTGLISLTGKIIDNFDIKFSEDVVEKNNLIEEIFANFLFQSVFKSSQNTEITTIKVKAKSIARQNGSNEVKGFGKKSKDAAYKLVNSLIKKSPILMHNFLEKSMIPLVQRIRRIESWNYTPPGSSEKPQKYVGMKNLGCICYMNSMIQQFFMIPSFRYNLLSVDDHNPEDFQEYKGAKIDDNVLHQFQKLIAHLELSERQDYNPFEFCFAFKDLDGNPTNTGEQKDAQEFLNLILDRVENQLRTTSRKYLLQSVFGGQTCSQMVCQECGKVKNRIEDFYNLSLPVKDIKSMEIALQKMIEGETINDYQCDGCNKKVDISRRTLISQTPNVLIVHLQRIVFNFDTFRNDKINSLWEFPLQLDLKPYSFFEVMRKENRIQTGEKGDEEQEDQKQENQDEDTQWPAEDDCFEYKLVGVNVHSGTANAGHYWSYINPMRGFLEPEGSNPNWNDTASDPWMEFNDSRVSDFNFNKLTDDCYGGDKKATESAGGWSFADSSSYGKSAYMLVYERQKKRPIKILLKDEELEAAQKSDPTSVQFDEKKQEHFKLIDYINGVEEIQPNQIYKQVFEDNMKFEFENDIYSQEFFDFIDGILKAVAALQSENASDKQLLDNCTKSVMKVGKKVILEIVAKCFYNKCITTMVDTFIELFKKDESLCTAFMEQCWQEDQFEYLLTLLLECADTQTRLSIGYFLKYILATLKYKEKDILYNIIQVESRNEKDEVVMIEVNEALSSRFFNKCIASFNTKVSKNWMKLDNLLEVLQVFALGDIDYKESDEKHEENEKQKLLTHLGLEFCFRHHFIEKACDFILGKKSPLFQLGEKRVEMGGAYSSPNFSALIMIITKMIRDETGLSQAHPLNETEQKMLLQHDLLKVMLGQSSGSKQFGQYLANMCHDNYKLSKKVAKVFMKAINGANYDTVKNYLKALKPFILINDSLKKQKLEWIFGYSQIVARKGYREEKIKYGLETLTNINEESAEYTSPIVKSIEDPFLGQLFKCKGRLDTFVINCLKVMISLMNKDEEIARHIYNQASPTYQGARYIDWFRPFLQQQQVDSEKNSQYSYMKAKYETILKALKNLNNLYETTLQKYAQDDQAQMEKAFSEGAFSNLDRDEDWLAYRNPDVIHHFPPQIILSQQVGIEEKEIYVNDENPHVKIVVTELINEYNYSNPTGFFNISVPHIELKTSNYQSLSYLQYKRIQITLEKQTANMQAALDATANEVTPGETTTTTETQSEQQQMEVESQTNANQDQDGGPSEATTAATQEGDATASTDNNATGAAAEQEELLQVKLINWQERVKQGSIVLKVYVLSKSKQKVTVIVSFKTSPEEANARLPVSFFKESITEGENKLLGHLLKIDPSKPWGDLKLHLEVKEKGTGGVPNPPKMNITGGIYIGDGKYLGCASCNKMNDQGSIMCIQCGYPLVPIGTSVGTGDDTKADSYFELDI